MTMPKRVWIESHTIGEMYDGTGEVYVSGPPTSGELEAGQYIRADIAEELARALGRVKALNMTESDDNGQQWASSDLIDQEVMFALARYNATKGD